METPITQEIIITMNDIMEKIGELVVIEHS